jgi:hypothetical protein
MLSSEAEEQFNSWFDPGPGKVAAIPIARFCGSDQSWFSDVVI